MTVAVLSAMVRPLLEGRLPPWVAPRWFATPDEANALAPAAEIGWFDMVDRSAMAEAIGRARAMRWLNSIYAGMDGMPLDQLARQGCVVTNGTGINAVTIAEYVVMGMLTIAKGYRDVVRAQDRHEWLVDAPGKVELAGSSALIIGTGAIGSLVATRLAAFDVAVTTVRRRADGQSLGPDDWRARLGDFDWVILAVPATPETDGMIGAAELAMMKPTARLVNVARGQVVDTAALVDALRSGAIGHAFLDVTDPEPLPADHGLWSLANAHVTMHLSGRSQTMMFQRSVERFVENLHRWHLGEPVTPAMDLLRGY